MHIHYSEQSISRALIEMILEKILLNEEVIMSSSMKGIIVIAGKFYCNHFKVEEIVQ